MQLNSCTITIIDLRENNTINCEHRHLSIQSWGTLLAQTVIEALMEQEESSEGVVSTTTSPLWANHTPQEHEEEEEDTHEMSCLLNNNAPKKKNLKRRRSISLMIDRFRDNLTRSSSFNSDIETEAEVIMTHTLEKLDDMEDEIDEIHYKKLLPIDLQIALEEKVFGWSHLSADVAGHLVYPALCGWVVYHLVTFVGVSFLGLQEIAEYDEESSSKNRSSSAGDNVLVTIRSIMTLFTIFQSYRTVRRRRKVWLRHSHRKRSVYDADRTTTMGQRWREEWRRRSMNYQMKKASYKFDRKLFTATQQLLNEHHHQGSSSTSKESKMDHDAPTTLLSNDNYESIISHEVIVPIPHIQKMLYSHGGYFAAAPYMLRDPQWIYILRQLMPDVYVEVAHRLRLGDAKLIHWAENNPVMAAYGTVMNERMNDSKNVGLEWDVFLDPMEVHNLINALNVREGLRCKNTGSHVDKLIQSRALSLLSSALIAHGNSTQLIVEQIEKPHILKSFNFSRVKNTRKTLGGGIEVGRWLAIYSKALQMGLQGSSLLSHDDAGDNNADENNNDNSSSEDEDTATLLTESIINAPMRKSIAAINDLLGRKLSVVIDMKSRHVDKRVLALFVSTFQRFGLQVEGIGSFVGAEVRGVSDLLLSSSSSSTYGRDNKPSPVREIYFYHAVGDLQRACHKNELRDGDTVFFNAGSLITSCFPTEHISKYKNKFNLNIGLYIQEFDVDPDTVKLIVEHINENMHVYSLGLSWGGVNGVTIKSIHPSMFRKTDGLWNQRYLSWDFRHDIDVNDEYADGSCISFRRNWNHLSPTVAGYNHILS